MAMTTAERQRRYMQRHVADGSDTRTVLMLSAQAHAALRRLAKHYGCSQRAVVERLLIAAENEAVLGLADPNSYYREER
jgi:hypothetical protein